MRRKIMERDQAYFWTDEWQAGEREAAEQIEAGEGRVFRLNDLSRSNGRCVLLTDIEARTGCSTGRLSPFWSLAYQGRMGSGVRHPRKGLAGSSRRGGNGYLLPTRP